ncbi:MAG: HK97 family phage prohead protease [Acidobacteria bacterium]|nr:HK97 family phage prohead protease [Acidobacteriota bacterium]
MPEYKALPAFTMGIDDRSVTGVFAVHGNIDDGGDRGHPGLFGDFTVGGRRRAVFLWQHNSMEPPIATIDRLFEVAKADLPAAVKLYAPDASGGVAVTRTYLDTELGNTVLAGLKAGAISEMSYAYQPTKWDFEEMDGRPYPIRNLYAADLLDVSDVNWGMNPATSAEGSKGQPLHIERAGALAALVKLCDRWSGLHSLRAKEGRRFSSSSVKEIEEAIAALEAATVRLKQLIADPEPEKVDAAAVMAARQTWERRRSALLRLTGAWQTNGE